MRLAEFIECNADAILEAAETFTAGLMPAAAHLSAEAMRDHLPMMLEAVVLDLRSEQSAPEALEKSLGLSPSVPGTTETAAQIHAVLRAKAGFDIEQVVAEYRAMRACVLRLWLPAEGTVDAQTLRDTVRFNEAIDQAVAESVSSFAAESERWRDVFLAVLGHDLRGPLNAVLLSAKLLSAMATEEPTTQYTLSLIRSGRRMQQLLDSLLDFSRSSLGRGIGIARSDVDLAEACRDEIEILRAALPGRTIELHASGLTAGSYDASRIREVLSNLVYNAARYSASDSIIRVGLDGDGAALALTVDNDGAPIAPSDLEAFFEPLRRGAQEAAESVDDRANLGLGLFIVQEIAKAHGGTVRASSDDGRTRFTVALPGKR